MGRPCERRPEVRKTLEKQAQNDNCREPLLSAVSVNCCVRGARFRITQLPDTPPDSLPDTRLPPDSAPGTVRPLRSFVPSAPFRPLAVSDHELSPRHPC